MYSFMYSTIALQRRRGKKGESRNVYFIVPQLMKPRKKRNPPMDLGITRREKVEDNRIQ